MKTRKEVFAGIVLARAKALEPALRRMAEVEMLNAEDIAPRLRITSPTVWRYARLLGVNLVRNNHPEKNYDKRDWLPTVRRMRLEGKEWAEIGKALGCSRITANRFGLDNGFLSYNKPPEGHIQFNNR